MLYLLSDNKRITRCPECKEQFIYYSDEIDMREYSDSPYGTVECPECGAEIEVLPF